MAITVQPREEVIPGYVLAERIGTGGYAEVWRAQAPGGIDKAVKIVNGYYDEEFATQEMKALERIKDVRHPFLLSLERFEVVDGRLAILTELADKSLEQRAQECRAEGQSGIPRSELLRYMADAAEALDYLTLRHGLQHLDIKPANLLVLGDHVKVADFGLVKELTTRTQNSLVAGLTPTYASPEMFDDSPSPQSDQYSLAIVYQELLVGVRAFPGRTAAQLAKQHTQAQPQLSALPAHDRPIVARALAKNPTDRHPSCRAFVEALVHATDADPVRHRTTSRSAASEPSSTPGALEDTKSSAAAATRPIQPASAPNVTQPLGPQSAAHVVTREAVESPAVEEIHDVSVPATELATVIPRTLFVGVGGVGIRILSRLRDMIAGGAVAAVDESAIEMAVLDTDRTELKEACSKRWNNPFAAEDVLHLPLRLPQDYGDDSRDSLSWLSRRWLYNIPRSLETQGYRPLGRIALVDHVEKTIALLDRKLKRLCTGAGNEKATASTPACRIVVVVGMGGGTGAGMVVDLANAARTQASILGMEAELHGILLSTCLGNVGSSVLAAANTYALLTELHHASIFGNRGALSQQHGEHPFESDGPPFDHVYCIPALGRAQGASPNDVLNSAATYMLLESTADIGTILRNCRNASTSRDAATPISFSLRSFGCARLSDRQRSRFDQLAIELANSVKRHWLTDATGAEWRNTVRKVDAIFPRTPPPTPLEGEIEGTNPPVSRPSQSELMRSWFGAQSSSRFALESISHLAQQSSRSVESGGTPYSPKRTHDVLGVLAHALASFAEKSNPSSDAAQSSSDGNLATLAALTEEVSCRVLAKVADEMETLRKDGARGDHVIEQILAAECAAALEHLSRKPEQAAAVMFRMGPDDVTHVLERASADLLKCGCDRRTMVVVPKSQAESIATPIVAAARPTSAVISAEVGEEIIICEESGIRPRSVAAGLERVYPGIAEAASRLLTRIDIEWQPLV
jgi:serine/threonine protein kinase